MLFDLPDTATLYQALLARDPSYDGRAYVCVSSTGIFCRLTCPARKPKPENCTFYSSVGECLQAGYRACRRCHPMAPAAEAEPAIKALLTALGERKGHRWSEPDIARMGLDPSTVRRVFNRHFGMTFLEMARLERLRNGHVALAGGGKVIEAQMDAGFESASAFRTAFARLMGQPPKSFSGDALVKADYIDTPLGAMIALSDQTHLHLLEFADRKALPTELRRMHQLFKGRIGIGRQAPMDLLETELGAYFSGLDPSFSVPLAFHGSDFTKAVWHALVDIPAGETRSYSMIAQQIGRPSAVRAVARANGANQIALLVPCHRVIGADGSLTGYGGGLWRKQKLIEIERRYAATPRRDGLAPNSGKEHPM
ncbi:MAG: trifunctional transcriptional activator/DNA repair protein Ada/methylated-DNA--[protein]-cysteine S-methyltransferase [Hoeflea sp.]|uniref:bifunctional transcriptional activator/DNA repair enzyme AdaA n=1 Tax=Hoeflea sp. TaxID=1940281 RepID=UPI001D1E9EBE|nr:trifunctional transcriptional activator/DNA repair protein Ada/methylated-DNA--[protein]-cysteine S-methyltransferase [Hoeflea sp.]MBU4530104.1 trifunctional transcriptional activator/DNA repair protein Ada/methylated-DNA--[protein]-cysteine S-methyltransferase [Alphaproteobacteria bacterium]MBU4542611.1 trifunctional transcriptional activator/DNA repair protein Ada/methylated-DNA--[protein]-cysteine S-methyltransferase [Alphaproteobacteria bacterium]MBU4551292.1 trifunctional transcriptional